MIKCLIAKQSNLSHCRFTSHSNMIKAEGYKGIGENFKFSHAPILELDFDIFLNPDLLSLGILVKICEVSFFFSTL